MMRSQQFMTQSRNAKSFGNYGERPTRRRRPESLLASTKRFCIRRDRMFRLHLFSGSRLHRSMPYQPATLETSKTAYSFSVIPEPSCPTGNPLRFRLCFASWRRPVGRASYRSRWRYRWFGKRAILEVSYAGSRSQVDELSQSNSVA
jgi:hypothetical protein